MADVSATAPVADFIADVFEDTTGGRARARGYTSEILYKFGSPAGKGVAFPRLGGNRLIKHVSFGRQRRKL